MSYNIDNVEVLECNATMKAKDVRRLLKKHEADLPEACFLHDLEDAAKASKAGDVKLGPGFDWYGEGSGHTFDFLREEVAPLISGTVKCILTWEGGDSISGFVIRDGVFIECDVVFIECDVVQTLVEREP